MQNDMRDRLIELLEQHCLLKPYMTDCLVDNKECSECLADHLIANGVIMPPVKVGDLIHPNWQLSSCWEVEEILPPKLRIKSVKSFSEDTHHMEVFIDDVKILARAEAEQALKERE